MFDNRSVNTLVSDKVHTDASARGYTTSARRASLAKLLHMLASTDLSRYVQRLALYLCCKAQQSSVRCKRVLGSVVRL